MPQEIEDLKTDEQKRQDAFENFAISAQIGQKATIIYCGDMIDVVLSSRTANDYEGTHPGNKIVSMKYLGKRTDITKTISIQTWSLNTEDDSELIKLY